MLGPLTKELILQACPIERQAVVSELLTQLCAESLPGVGNGAEWLELIDRVQLAAIRISAWDVEKLKEAVALARMDWRDVLVGAGFGNSLSEHLNWQKATLQSHTVGISRTTPK